jgi:hypothetical protein
LPQVPQLPTSLFRSTQAAPQTEYPDWLHTHLLALQVAVAGQA